MNDKNNLYTKIFEKCSPKEKESGEFEDCCKNEMKNILEKDIEYRQTKIMKKMEDKKLYPEMEKAIDNARRER